MKKNNLVFIKHIRDAIIRIKNFTLNHTKSKFLKDELVQSAVIRQIEIIGEASKNLSLSFRNKHSQIPFKDIAGMRDKLIHHYFGVDINSVWNTVKSDLPKLENQINQILKNN